MVDLTKPEPNQPPKQDAILPRWAIVAATFVILGLLALAVYRSDYRIVAILLVPVMFVFGADLGAWIRSWRGSAKAGDTP